MKTSSTKTISAALLLAFATLARADIGYEVRPLPESLQVVVKVSIPNAGTETTVQMPRWMPGFYVLQDYGKAIKDLTASGADGQALTVESVDANTWKLKGTRNQTVVVTYKAPMEFAAGTAHYGGVSTYVYIPNRMKEKCTLHLDIPKDWNVAVGLDGKGTDYWAEDYDVLADNSVTMGQFHTDSYTSAGKVHTLALRGPGASKEVLASLKKQCEFISNAETDFMGGAPFNKYVWHFSIGSSRGGGSGIEHLTSTNIGLGNQIEPWAAGLLAHEYFHLWNVKRIRSKVLGPFDYTQLPKTGALWWLEGVTEYFSSSLLARYGWTPEKNYLVDVANNVRNLRNSPERLKVSAFDCSYRVGETNGGRGNSNGFGLSYYTLGYVLGLVFDLELLAKTNGKQSLDDVEMALWRMCRDGQPGFEEDEIRKQLIAAGGDSFGPLYDKFVMTPGELPVDEALGRVGLELGSRTEMRASVGFTSQPNVGKAGMEVMGSEDPEIAKVLPKGTIVRAINGKAIAGASPQVLRGSFMSATSGLTPGAELSLKVLLPGSDQESAVTIKAASIPFAVFEIRPTSAPTAEQLRLRGIWLAKKRK